MLVLLFPCSYSHSHAHTFIPMLILLFPCSYSHSHALIFGSRYVVCRSLKKDTQSVNQYLFIVNESIHELRQEEDEMKDILEVREREREGERE